MESQEIQILAALGTALSAVVVAPVVQVIIGLRQSAAAKMSARAALLSAQNSGRHSVSKFRQEWINSLRKDLAEFHSILMTQRTYPFPDEVHHKLSEIGTRIELSLNPNEELTKKLLKVMDDIFECDKIEDRWRMDKEFVKVSQNLLKDEWERVKKELLDSAI